MTFVVCEISTLEHHVFYVFDHFQNLGLTFIEAKFRVKSPLAWYY